MMIMETERKPEKQIRKSLYNRFGLVKNAECNAKEHGVTAEALKDFSVMIGQISTLFDASGLRLVRLDCPCHQRSASPAPECP